MRRTVATLGLVAGLWGFAAPEAGGEDTALVPMHNGRTLEGWTWEDPQGWSDILIRVLGDSLIQHYVHGVKVMEYFRTSVGPRIR